MKRPLGIVLHRGASIFDGSPYVVIMPLTPSGNSKTGKMLQTYIIRSGVNPVAAVQSGRDLAICGSCPLRGLPRFKAKRSKRSKLRACYVNVGQGPAMVYKALQRKRYVDYVPAIHDRYIVGRKIRFGTYGEPVLIPLELVEKLSSISSGWTGYTHQWSNPSLQQYRKYFMASVHGLTGPDSREHAKHLGWRTFRTTSDGLPAANEILCPASKEAGRRLTCFQCNLCDAEGRRKVGLEAVDVYIPTHGGRAVMNASRLLPILQN